MKNSSLFPRMFCGRLEYCRRISAGQPRQRPHQPDWSAVICFFLKFLNFLKLLIACHALPHAYGFAVITEGWTSPALPCLEIIRLRHRLWQMRELHFLF